MLFISDIFKIGAQSIGAQVNGTQGMYCLIRSSKLSFYPGKLKKNKKNKEGCDKLFKLRWSVLCEGDGLLWQLEQHLGCQARGRRFASSIHYATPYIRKVCGLFFLVFVFRTARPIISQWHRMWCFYADSGSSSCCSERTCF